MPLFYKLTTDTAADLIAADLPPSGWKLWVWVTTLNPFADRQVQITWQTATKAIDISKTTFYRALGKLVDSGLLASQKISGFCVSFKNGTPDPNLKIESQNWQFQSQNCDSSLYIDLQTDQTLSEGESQEKSRNESESKTVGQDSPVMAEVIQTATVNPIALGEEKFSAAARTKKSTKGFNWLPDGPWNIEGKLDPNFRDFIANNWLKRFGGDIHAKRADVLSHFKKDPANLPIRWEQYQSEFLNRVQNTQILLSNGLEVKPETQDKLLTNHRALTAKLPAEMNIVATEQSRSVAVPGPIAAVTEVAALPGAMLEAEATAPAHAEGPQPGAETPSKSSDEVVTPSKNSITSPKPLVKSSALPQTPSKNSSEEIVNEDGQRLKVFKCQGVTEQGRSEEDDRDPVKLRAMVQGFLKGFAGGQTPSNSSTLLTVKKSQAQTELEKLNSWLHDPLLRDNTIAWVNRSESFKYCPDLDQIIEASEF
jgi:hypothetical protein